MRVNLWLARCAHCHCFTGRGMLLKFISQGEYLHCCRCFSQLGWNKADSWAWWGKPKAMQQLWIPQQRLSVSSEGIILSVLHAVRPASPCQSSSATDNKVCTWTRGKLKSGTDLLSNLYTQIQVNLIIFVPRKRDFFKRDTTSGDNKHAGDLEAS